MRRSGESFHRREHLATVVAPMGPRERRCLAERHPSSRGNGVAPKKPQPLLDSVVPVYNTSAASRHPLRSILTAYETRIKIHQPGKGTSALHFICRSCRYSSGVSPLSPARCVVSVCGTLKSEHFPEILRRGNANVRKTLAPDIFRKLSPPAPLSKTSRRRLSEHTAGTSQSE